MYIGEEKLREKIKEIYKLKLHIKYFFVDTLKDKIYLEYLNNLKESYEKTANKFMDMIVEENCNNG